MIKKIECNNKEKMVVIENQDGKLTYIRYNERMRDLQTGLLVSAATGKMVLIPIITTSCLLNANCEKNSKIPGSICHECYAGKTYNSFKGKAMKTAHEKNTVILTSKVLSEKDVKRIAAIIRLQVGENGYVRFESHGDLNNKIHLENYFNISKAAPDLKFALWTKQYKLLIDCYNSGDMEKPENLNIIVSSLFINKIINIECPWIDVIFTVYNFEYIISHPEININCAMRKCYFCGRCYEKHTGIIYVNECLKSDQTKLYNYYLSKLAMNAAKPVQELKRLKELYKDSKEAVFKMFNEM